MCERIAFIEFATEAVAEKMMEAAQGSDVRGNSIFIDYTGEKNTSLLGQLQSLSSLNGLQFNGRWDSRLNLPFLIITSELKG